MRTAVALIPVVFLAGTAAAQPGPYLAEVTADRIAVRAGPSDLLPETGVLFRGVNVLVDHEEGDWLAVQPPRGQVSWLRGVHLEPMNGQTDTLPRNAIVNAEPEAEVAHGRPGLGHPLDVRRTRIADRTIVLVIGRMVVHNGVNWVPIEPPDGDFRYLPRSALRFVKGQPSRAFVVHSPKAEPAPKSGFEPVAASIPSGTAGSARPADWPNHPIWQQAEQAEKSLDYTRAETLYLKLAAEMNQSGGDAELANLCYSRVHAVREKQRSASIRPAADPARRAEPPRSGQWHGPGALRMAGFKWDGRPTFALVGPQGQLTCYAVAGVGVDLDRFRGAEVDLFGAAEKPADLRGVAVVTVTRVQSARDR